MNSSYVQNQPTSLAGFSPGQRTLRLTSPMMQGEDVQYVQLRVGASPDAVYGPKTVSAVKEFQKEKRLSVTGEVDSITWTALEKTGSAAGKAKIKLTGSNHSKSSLMYWSAAGVGAIGLAALTAKILNS